MKTRANPDAVLNEELSFGERLLWSGQPRQGILFNPGLILSVLVSLALVGIIIIGVICVLGGNASEYYGILGMIGAAAVIYMFVVIFLFGPRIRAKTFYGITDQRIIIKSKSWAAADLCISLENLNRFTLKLDKDGSGSIVFDRLMAGPKGAKIYVGRIPLAIAFEGIENAQAVYDLVQQARRDSP